MKRLSPSGKTGQPHNPEAEAEALSAAVLGTSFWDNSLLGEAGRPVEQVS